MYLTLYILGNFYMFFVVCDFFSNLMFSTKSFRNTTTCIVSSGLDPDQDRLNVGPDVGPYCL